MDTEKLASWARSIVDSERLHPVRRTIICRPELEADIRRLIEEHDMGDGVTVRASSDIPEDQIIIIKGEHNVRGS